MVILKLNIKKEIPITSYKVTILNPMDYVEIQVKEKKMGKWINKIVRKYCTANVWYGSTGSKLDRKIKGQIKKKVMWFLHSYVNNIPKFTTFPLRFTYIYHAPLNHYDLQNKCYFWAKLFEDYIVSKGIIPDDDVNYIQSERYEYVESDIKKLIIKIEVI